MEIASIGTSVGDLTALHRQAMWVLLWIGAGYAALFVILYPILYLAGQKKAGRVLTGFLYCLPLLAGTLYVTFLIFVVQIGLIENARSGTVPPHLAFEVSLQDRIREKGLDSEGSTDPYDALIKASPKFASTGMAGSAKWSLRVAGRAMGATDFVILAFLFFSLMAAVGPVSADLLTHPFRRAAGKESVGGLLWTVFKRLLGMILYMAIATAVFALLSKIFLWVTYAVTSLASGMIADLSAAASRAPSVLVFIHILAALVFLLEMVGTIALTTTALSASVGTSIKWRLQGWLMGGPIPHGFRDSFIAFFKLVSKILAVTIAAFVIIKVNLFILPYVVALPFCVLVETAEINGALWWMKAHRDAKRLGAAFWRLHIFGVAQLIKEYREKRSSTRAKTGYSEGRRES